MQNISLDKLFSKLCCSACKNDFEEESFQIVREESGFIVVRIECLYCKKSFGLAFLGIDGEVLDKSIKKDDVALEIQELPPISYDDILDAHLFIKDLDKNWQEYQKKLK